MMSNYDPLERKDIRQVQPSRDSAPVLQAADYQVGVGRLKQLKLTDRSPSIDLPALTMMGLDNSSPSDCSEIASAFATERTELLRSASQHLTAEQLSTLERDMSRFEARMSDKPQEVAATYTQMERLIQAGRGAILDQPSRNQIALDVMHQSADPRSVQQSLQSCTVASLESRIYTRHPSAAAQLITDVATTGSYHGQHMDRNSVAIYEFPHAKPGDDRLRSYASQLFQITAANVFHQLESGTKPTDRQYILTPPAANQIRRELLVNKETGAVIASHPDISINDTEGLRRLNNAIVGADEPPFVINLAQNPTESEFRATLQQLASDKNYPALLAVRANSNLINGANGPVPYHLLALEQGADAEHVFINNQFNGQAGDFETTVKSAFNGMRLNDDLVQSQSWRNIETEAMSSIIAMGENGQLTADILKNVQNTLLEFKPEHIRAIESEFTQRYNRNLPELLSNVLQVDDNQMRLLGYEHDLLSGWTHAD